jgi:hypothetical protein
MYRYLDTYPMRSIAMATCLTCRTGITTGITISIGITIGITVRRYDIRVGDRAIFRTITATTLVLGGEVSPSIWDSKPAIRLSLTDSSSSHLPRRHAGTMAVLVFMGFFAAIVLSRS